jgi:hypothetical protein
MALITLKPIIAAQPPPPPPPSGPYKRRRPPLLFTAPPPFIFSLPPRSSTATTELHCRRSTVDRVPGRSPSPMDPVHGFSYSEIIPYHGYIRDLPKRSLDFWEINPRSRILHPNPRFLKNNSREVPSPRKIHKIALQTSNPHIFPTTTPNLVIATPKILESLLLLLSTFIIHMFVAIIYCFCLFVLGTIVSEPFIGDFQDLQGKCP